MTRKEVPMPTYVTLFRWTQKGAEHVKQSPARLDKIKEAIHAAGGTMKAFYLTMGQYDGITISEAPSDEVYARTILAATSQGNVH
jgi:uncharacterized protein with GYD domain